VSHNVEEEERQVYFEARDSNPELKLLGAWPTEQKDALLAEAGQ
jgi:hypothetical protein